MRLWSKTGLRLVELSVRQKLPRPRPTAIRSGCRSRAHWRLLPSFTRSCHTTRQDFAPIVLVGTAPNVLGGIECAAVSSFKEFLAYARQRPGQLNYASLGNGSASHLSMEMLKTEAGLFLVHIPFNGAPPAVQATAAGDVHAVMSNPTTLLPVAATGRIRLLAVTSRERWPALPNVPTVHEAVSGLRSHRMEWLVAPAATQRTRSTNSIARSKRFRAAGREVTHRGSGWQVGAGRQSRSRRLCRRNVPAGNR